MVEKTSEQLAEQILELTKKLQTAESYKAAADTLQELAKSLGIKFVYTSKTTVADCEEFLAAAHKKVASTLEEEIETLKFKLEGETKAVEELMEVRDKLNGDVDDLGRLLKEKTSALVETEKKLQETIRALAEKTLLVEQLSKELAKVKGTKKVSVDKYERVIALGKDLGNKAMARLKEINALKEEIKALQARLLEADERIKILEEESAGRERRISELDDKVGSLESSTVLGAEIIAMIENTFREHGYNAIPTFDGTAENKKNRQNELYKAIENAKKADKKEEALAKKQKRDVVYPPDGYNKIHAEIVEKYNKILETHDKALVEEFKNTYASEEDKGDGVVTNGEVLETILKKEPQPKYSLKQKVAFGLAIAVTIAVIVFGTIFGVNYAKSQNTQIDEDTTISEVQPTVMDLDVSSQQVQEAFAANKTLLTSPLGGAVRGLKSCEYDRATGRVTIELDIKTADRKEATEEISFTLDLATMSQDVRDGKVVLDFETIVEQMLEKQTQGQVEREIFVKATTTQNDNSSSSQQGDGNAAGQPAGGSSTTSQPSTNGGASNTAGTTTTTDPTQTPTEPSTGVTNTPVQGGQTEDENVGAADTPVEVAPIEYIEVTHTVRRDLERNWIVICNIRHVTVVDGKETVVTSSSQSYRYDKSMSAEDAKESATRSYLESLGLDSSLIVDDIENGIQ